MCSKTGIKDAYWGLQGACPRRAVTHAGGTAERSERRAVGMGLKLVYVSSTLVSHSLQLVMPRPGSARPRPSSGARADSLGPGPP